MGVRLRFASTARFWADTAGIVTVQMVMFSVLLFGGIGMMMDFGRAYSAHSQIQGYIDQVALAAAQQLDGKPGAIMRATAAANAVTKQSSFTDGGGEFNVEQLVFMRDAPTDSSGNFSSSLAATFATTEDEVATHVLAVARNESIALKLLRFGSTKSENQQGEWGNDIDQIDVGAAAVAMSKTVTCGGLSTLVMCNPFENHTDTSWQAEMAASEGWRMMLTSDILNGAKPSNFTGGHEQIRLGLLKSPDTLMEVRNLVCSDLFYLPGYDPTDSTQSIEDLKDMCLLATVETGLSCVNDQVAFKAAHPTTVTTGLGAAFDMFDGPIAEVIDPGEDQNLLSLMPGWATMRSELFYPDAVPAHGRMTRQDYEIVLQDREADIPNNPAVQNAHPFFRSNIIAAIQAQIDAERAVYGVDPNIPVHSRLNHIHVPGYRDEWGPAPTEACLSQSNGIPNCSGAYKAIHTMAPGQNDIHSYAGELYTPYATQQYMDANPGVYANWWDVPPAVVDSETISLGYTSYYDFYSGVERMTSDMQAEAATHGHTGGTDAGAAQMPPGYGVYGTQTSAKHFPNVYGSGIMGSVERRKQRVTVVNCEGAESYASATGENNSSFNDTFMGEVVDVVDIHLLTPPEVKGCEPALTNDPHKNFLCPNTDITKVNLDVEIVDSASMNPNAFDARYYAVLVH